MIDTIHSPDVYVKDTGTVKGRGAFAQRDFAAGEIVEECPVIILLRPYEQLPLRLKTMVFNWGNLAKTSPCHALALGFGSMYNHDNPASLRYEADTENDAMRYIAARAIKEDEELTINYNASSGGHESEEDTWFQQHQIEVLSET